MWMKPWKPRTRFARKLSFQKGRRQTGMEEGVVTEGRSGILHSLQHILNVRAERRAQRLRMLKWALIGRNLADVGILV